MNEQVKQLGDQLVGLNAGQVSSLRTYLKDTYGEAFSFEEKAADPGPKPDPTPVVEEKTIFDVVLKGFDPAKKMMVLKVVRAVTGLSLMDVKNFLDALPKTVKEAFPKADAEKLKKELEDNGGVVELK